MLLRLIQTKLCQGILLPNGKSSNESSSLPPLDVETHGHDTVPQRPEVPDAVHQNAFESNGHAQLSGKMHNNWPTMNGLSNKMPGIDL